MQSVLAKEGETLFDIAVVKTGSIESIVAMAIANDMSPTDDLVSGQTILVTDVVDADIVEELSQRDARPASGDINIESVPEEGIGHWIIGLDFIVS